MNYLQKKKKKKALNAKNLNYKKVGDNYCICFEG